MLPNSSATGGGSALEGAFDGSSAEGDDQDFTSYQYLDQISEGLVTLSLGPRNKMHTLLHLDVIKQRSKPVEPPKKQEAAPFFLQLSGEKVGDEASAREGVSQESPEAIQKRQEMEAKSLTAEEQLNKFKPTGRLGFESKFTKLLRESSEIGDYASFLKYLISLSPGSVDLEIRSLDSYEPFSEMIWFINALKQGLESNKNIDLYEAFMSLLFKAHGDVLHANNQNEDLRLALSEWQSCHTAGDNLDNLIKYCAGVINFISGV